jgi:hypothetical protein
LCHNGSIEQSLESAAAPGMIVTTFEINLAKNAFQLMGWMSGAGRCGAGRARAEVLKFFFNLPASHRFHWRVALEFSGMVAALMANCFAY